MNVHIDDVHGPENENKSHASEKCRKETTLCQDIGIDSY